MVTETKIVYIYDSPLQTKKKSPSKNCKKMFGNLPEVYNLWSKKKGDTAIIYMPMIPQAAYAMLACARLGIMHSVVFGGFVTPRIGN